MDSIPEKISLRKDTIISGKSLVGTIVPVHKKGDGIDLSWLLPVLGWILGVALLLFILMLLGWLFYRLWQEISRRRNTTPINHVHIGRGNIDQATDAAILAADVERSYRFRERTAEIMLTNPNLTRATMTENSNQTRDFIVTTEYQVR